MWKKLALVTVVGALALTGCTDKNKTAGPATAPADQDPQPIVAPPYTPLSPSAYPTTAPAYVPPPVIAPPAAATPIPAPHAAAPSSPAPAKPVDNTYVIQKGDTLYAIAKKHYGDGKKAKDIKNANPGLDPAKLKVGDKIILP